MSPLYSRQQTLRLALLCTAAIFAVVVLLALRHHAPTNPVFADDRLKRALPTVWVVVAATSVAIGLGVVTALAAANRRRLPVVLRFSIGRAISCVLLTLLTPVALWGTTPIALGFVMLLNPQMFFAEGWFPGAWSVGVLILGAVWYGLSSLLIAGIRNKTPRVLMFGQLWLTVYCAVLLYLGDVSPF